jgi:hypothetical protein
MLYNGSASAARNPASTIFNIDGASKLALGTDSQIGRETGGFSAATGSVTINVSGSGTVLEQTGTMWLGWTASATAPTYMNITDGALVKCLTNAGFAINQNAYTGSGSTAVSSMNGNNYARLNLSNGTLQVKGDRRTLLNNYIALGWISGNNGTVLPAVSYDAATGFTTVTATPEPATMALLGLGSLFFVRRK